MLLSVCNGVSCQIFNLSKDFNAQNARPLGVLMEVKRSLLTLTCAFTSLVFFLLHFIFSFGLVQCVPVLALRLDHYVLFVSPGSFYRFGTFGAVFVRLTSPLPVLR